MDENLEQKYKDLKQSYNNLVGQSIITIFIYEEYLMNKESSQTLAKSMLELLSMLPTEVSNKMKNKRRGKGTSGDAVESPQRPSERRLARRRTNGTP